jgi:DNA-binding response OmpR family regulator
MLALTQAKPHHGPGSAPREGARVLVVESDPDLRRLWQTILARDGHQVTGAAHPAALAGKLPRLRGSGFCLIIIEGALLVSAAEALAWGALLRPGGEMLITGPCSFSWPGNAPVRGQLWRKPFAVEDLRHLARALAAADTLPVALIADDCAATRALWSLTARSVGFDAVELDDGVDVLEVAEATAPRVILLDVHMPRQDGLATLRQLRKAGVGSHVIMISGGSPVYLHTAGQLGADHILIKPVAIDQLRTILAALRGSQSEPQRTDSP